MHIKFIPRRPLAVIILAAMCTTAQAQTQLDSVLSIKSEADRGNRVSYVREQTLRESAVALGARAGLADRSRELIQILASKAPSLDAQFNFNKFVMGAGVLPPVISESKNVVALESNAMRVAGAVYHIDSPARFAMPTPTWRDWLYIGLDEAAVAKVDLGAGAPETEAESALWKRLVLEGYAQGREQAQSVFNANLALLQRSHEGMRLYFDLWQRGMVSAPIIASSSEVVVREDDNSIAVGNTLYRITAKTDFTSPQKWIPLE